MMEGEIIFSKLQYEVVRRHLFQGPGEGTAFAFSSISEANGIMSLKVCEFDLIPQSECIGETEYGIELSDAAWNRVMARAFATKTSLIEMHSHPFSHNKVAFSSMDVNGLKDLVPQLWWRLENRPYAALVFGRSSIDALVWLESPQLPQMPQNINIQGRKIKPTGVSLSYFQRSHENGRTKI
jgi:hypothetical protein